ncbi:hypothetical protein Daura_13105 [Dactylosporangium aurantiacum]|uniref:Uncharacterized protein n=1 Tax=Dactylosporangium aurantiacum TaxID=35754 RepID=A0A9Q9IPM8_9ACTN|nr:hypothetical protein [Dactylosporangium aurantiacum]MDG6105652.1 hypothetical protein [Dactylosporangium aurantiacum]UWZ57015.1 hypothetical protein Daura_13105 [Dactylosporangium aurantiacum]
MNEALARRYGRLIRMYPRDYRASHGDEIVATLLAVARPGQRRPDAREVVALAVEATRLRAAGAVAGRPVWWLDGLHMAAFLLALGTFATALGQSWFSGVYAAWPLLLAAVFVALLIGRPWLALPFALAEVFGFSRLQLREVWPSLDELPPFSPQLATPAELAPCLTLLVAVVALGTLSWRRKLRRRSWWWLAVPAGAFLAQRTMVAVPESARWVAAVAIGQVALLSLALGWTVITRDGRWALAAVVFFAPDLVWLRYNRWLDPSPLGVAYWVVVGVLTLAIVAAAGWPWHRRRSVRTSG